MNEQKQQTETTEVTPTPPDNTGLSIVNLGRENYDGEDTIANFNPADPKFRNMYLQSANEPDFRPSSMEGEVFMLVHWMAERGVFRNEESGEEVTGVRLCLWDDKSRMLTSVSWAVTRFMNKLRKVYGDGPYDPPIGLLFENKIRGDKKRTYAVSVVE